MRGSSAATVGGALVVQSPDPATLARTVRRLPALIRRSGHDNLRVVPRGVAGFDVSVTGKPRTLKVRAGRSGAVAALGAGAVRAAQNPADKLGDTDLFRKAAAAVGERPTLFVDFAPALQLAATSPHHRADKHFQRALPRLQHLEYLAVGARRDGGLDVVRAVLGLR